MPRWVAFALTSILLKGAEAAELASVLSAATSGPPASAASGCAGRARPLLSMPACAFRACPPSQSTHIFTFTFEDGEELLLWMGDRWQPHGTGSVGGASYVWLPLLPHAQGPGFELVWAEGWSLR